MHHFMDSAPAMRGSMFRALCLVMFAVVLLSATALRPSVAHACLWDRDTLATEFEGAESVVHAILGRFPRNPPLFYEMRLARIEQELAGNPADRLALLDDAAVACDRLGRSDCAVSFMAQKKLLLDDPNFRGYSAEQLVEHEYRYLANLGTFHAHKALAAGETQGPDMVIAVDLIRQAIALNPDAHFGREAVQLMILELFLDPPDEPIHLYWEFGRRRFDSGIEDADTVVQGLAGLVLLGNAWQSPLVFDLLCASLLRGDIHASLAALAQFRAEELVQAGAQLPAWIAPFEGVARLESSSEAAALDYFTRARDSADRWHSARMDYLESRLARGVHPDTHPDFWDDFVEPEDVWIPGEASLEELISTLGQKGGVFLLMNRYPKTWYVVVAAFLFGLVWILVRRHHASVRREQVRKAQGGGVTPSTSDSPPTEPPSQSGQ